MVLELHDDMPGRCQLRKAATSNEIVVIANAVYLRVMRHVMLSEITRYSSYLYVNNLSIGIHVRDIALLAL